VEQNSKKKLDFELKCKQNTEFVIAGILEW
jgi:hypothetical protein